MPTHVKRTAEDKIDHVGPAAKKQKIDTKVQNVQWQRWYMFHKFRGTYGISEKGS